MIQLARVSKDDTVIDIGAGKGAVTTLLAQKADKVIAIEYDRDLVDVLRSKTVACNNVKVIHRDIMITHLPRHNYLVVANIPYSITTSIMKKLLNNPMSGLQRAVIVMEKGAAKRFTSKVVKDPYVIAWRMWFEIKFVRDIARTNFSPPPKVDSAIVKITRKENPIVPPKDYQIFWGLVDDMFRDPWLALDQALLGVFTPPQIKQLKRNLGIKNDLPVALLSATQWGIIFDTMIQHVPRFRWPKLVKKKIDQYFG